MGDKSPQLRIIGGQWRGRKLPIVTLDGLRPTGDRIRETLFNWLTADIVDSRCLDLFAGSGALGFECLSRGALETVLLEKHPQAAKQLQQHSQTLDTSRAKIIQCDALQWLKTPDHAQASINIAFIDPPFAANLWDEAIAGLASSGLLQEGALIYIETPKDFLLSTPAHWQLHKEKRAGQICYRLFRYITD